MGPSSEKGVNAATAAGGPTQTRMISALDIQLVQNLVERCLQLHMSQTEVISILNQQAKIEPGFTNLVWQKLEEQNPDFFRAYYTRLRLKDQIMLFNHLLEQHVQLCGKLRGAQGPPVGYGGHQMAYAAHGMHPQSQLHQTHAPQSVQLGTPPPVGMPGGAGGFDGGTPGVFDINGAGAGGASSLFPTPGGPHLGGTATGMPSGLDGTGTPDGLSTLPRNFSLSDLSMELSNQVSADGDMTLALLGGLSGDGDDGDKKAGDEGGERDLGKLPKSFSFSDMAGAIL